MAGPGTHLSVRVQSGYRIILTKIRYASLEIMFAELHVFLHLSEDDEHVGKRCVHGQGNDRGSSGGGGAQVDLTASVALCEEFSAKYVTFILSDDDSVGLNPTRTNTLEVLMLASRDRS